MSLPLQDRVAIVVGSSSGMGRATAVAYAAAGAKIVAAARTSDGRGLAGVLHPEARLDLDQLSEEVAVLDRAFSGETHVIVYRTTADPRSPLEAEVAGREVRA